MVWFAINANKKSLRISRLLIVSPTLAVCAPITKALGVELSKEKEKKDRLESDAVEMRERLKKLDKYEKNEKGHNAMTEELKKMEKETGLSVSIYV